MTAIFEALVECLAVSGLEISQDEENGRAWLEYEGDAGTWLLVGEAHEDLDLAAVAAVPRGRVRPERREAVALLLADINFGTLLGGWSMDPEDGELRYRAAAPVTPATAAETIRTLIGAAVTAPERWLEEIEQAAA